VPVTAGSGTNIDTRTNAGGEHRQVIIIGDGQATSDLIATFRPDSVLRAAIDPTTLLVDSFDALDTVNTWTTGGNNIPTVAAGKLTVSAAITASMQSTIRSMPAFVYRSPSYLQGAFLATLEAGAVTGNKRCWGFGTLPATSTVAIPLANGVCFEIQDTDGALVGAAYSNSTRTQTVALTRPADGAEHRYGIYYKTSRVYFEIDNVIAGSIATPDPQIMTLPLVAVSVNAAAGQPGTAAVLTFSTISASDSGRNNTAISDPSFPWRQAQVGKSGGLAVRGALPAIQTLAVTAATPVTGTGLDVSEAGNVSFVIKNTVAATAYTGVPVIVFEQSDDNVSWGPLQVTGVLGATSSSPPIATGAANASQFFDAACEGVNWVRVRVVTAQSANGMTVVTQPGGMAFSPSVSAVAPAPPTGVITSVAAAITSTTILVANTGRRGAAVFNDSTANLKLGLTASAVSATAFTVKIGPGGFFEVPYPAYVGQLTGIWDAAAGSARVTELT
jgi:hypothetical protein